MVARGRRRGLLCGGHTHLGDARGHHRAALPDRTSKVYHPSLRGGGRRQPHPGGRIPRGHLRHYGCRKERERLERRVLAGRRCAVSGGVLPPATRAVRVCGLAASCGPRPVGPHTTHAHASDQPKRLPGPIRGQRNNKRKLRYERLMCKAFVLVFFPFWLHHFPNMASRSGTLRAPGRARQFLGDGFCPQRAAAPVAQSCQWRRLPCDIRAAKRGGAVLGLHLPVPGPPGGDPAGAALPGDRGQGLQAPPGAGGAPG